MLALVWVVTAFCVGGFLMTEVGQERRMDQALRRTAPDGPGADARQQFEKIRPYLGVTRVGQTLAMPRLWSLLVSSVLFVVITALAQVFIWP